MSAKLGTVATGASPHIIARVQEKTFQRVQAFAKRNKLTMSQAVRILIERALTTIRPYRDD